MLHISSGLKNLWYGIYQNRFYEDLAGSGGRICLNILWHVTLFEIKCPINFNTIALFSQANLGQCISKENFIVYLKISKRIM